jgi:hypothetical protein
MTQIERSLKVYQHTVNRLIERYTIDREIIVMRKMEQDNHSLTEPKYTTLGTIMILQYVTTRSTIIINAKNQREKHQKRPKIEWHPL